MIGFLSALIVALAVVTLAVMVAGVVVGVHLVSLYRQGLAVRDDVFPRLQGSRAHFEGLKARSLRIRQTLLAKWQRLRPAVEQIERESTHTLQLWKHASTRATDEARKARAELRIVRAAL